MQNNNSVGKTSLQGEQWSAGIAYIAIPSDIEREIYIKECYFNSRVSIWSEDAGFLNRVPIDEDKINFIDFPLTSDKLGTGVVFITEPIHKQPIIIARLPKTDELGELRENQFKIKRKFGDKFVEISGSSDRGTLNLIVNSKSEKGSINISLNNINNDGELNLDIAGNVKVNATGNVEFSQRKRFFTRTTNEKETIEASFEQTEEENRFIGKKFVLNEGEVPMVLGSELKTLLGTLIEKVAGITVINAPGVMPIVNSADILLLKKQLDKMLSKEGFLKQ